MATATSAVLHILASASVKSTSPHLGDITETLENTTGGTRWTDGTGSGQVDRAYRVTGSLGSGATNSYNLLAAGALLDVFGQAIDGDELKGMVIKVTSGTIALEAPAANFLGIFADATDLINLANGMTIAFDFGSTGLDITTNASFDIVEKAASTATYELWLILAQ